MNITSAPPISIVPPQAANGGTQVGKSPEHIEQARAQTEQFLAEKTTASPSSAVNIIA